VEICPVGALTSRDFRFKARAWHLTGVESICPGCSRGCNILIDFKDRTIYRLRARLNENVNGWWMCDEGRVGFHFVNGSDRILRPLRRVGGKQVPFNLDDALVSVCQRLQKILADSGPGAVGGIASSSCTNEENYVLVKFLKEVVGTPHVDVILAGRGEGHSDRFLIQADKSPNSRGAEEVGCTARGGSLKVMDMIEAAHQGKLKALFIMGQDVVRRLPDSARVKEALERLELLVAQDSGANDTTRLARYVLPKATFAEMDGTFTNSDGRVQRIHPAFHHEEVWPGWRTMSALAERMGHDLRFSSAEEVFAEMAKTVPGYHGLSYERIGSHGTKRGEEAR
jgi:NADH-quinone oxidoreductase subunit G